MSHISSRGNKDTELVLARLLHAHGITGWRRHLQIVVSAPPFPQRGEEVKVRPDFVFSRQSVAVFVDGCFWHGCPRHATKPKSNRAFWSNKLTRNTERDRLVNGALRRIGWRVIRIWECSLARRPKTCVKRIQRALALPSSCLPPPQNLA